MTIALKEWNILDHLKTEEDITLYLEACFEEAGDDSDFIAQAINLPAASGRGIFG
ncbi:MAG: hypothetical protein WCL34_10200 [Methylococcaceae bacterium]|jgi:DNA-binding phage protein